MHSKYRVERQKMVNGREMKKILKYQYDKEIGYTKCFKPISRKLKNYI